MENSVTEEKTVKPAFHIHESNQLTGNKIHVVLNPLMARALCEMIESVDLTPEERSLYAFAKHIRRHYAKLNKQMENSVCVKF